MIASPAHKNRQLLPNHNQENTNKQTNNLIQQQQQLISLQNQLCTQEKIVLLLFQASTTKRAPSSQHKQSKTRQDNKTQICQEQITTSSPHRGLSLIQ
jgi:hypothetical protein